MMRRKYLGWIVAALTFCGSAALIASQGFSLINGAFDFYQKTHDAFFQKKAEDNLHVIYTGTSIKYIESIFGPPIKESHNKEKQINQYLYSFKKFYLQIVFDDSNTVIFYAVTSKDLDFHPSIPYLNSQLGFNFTHYGEDDTFLYSDYSSKFYEYAEYHYLGNPGNYRNFYLAYNPAGVDYQALQPLPDMMNDEKSPPKQADLKAFRKQNAPNTFAVGDINGNPEGPEMYFGIGIGYYDARDIPDKDD
ncbi:hypothetical protein DFO53_4248 [Enterobacter sp. AG5470]|nr:hypothetical protein DFO53_4248 [Enterobacter sp. AG5470]